jgi:hypothetical protein
MPRTRFGSKKKTAEESFLDAEIGEKPVKPRYDPSTESLCMRTLIGSPLLHKQGENAKIDRINAEKERIRNMGMKRVSTFGLTK